jgi:ATP-binding cassette subfamily B protein/subfamily B ATP-binding cassette protein MsbA
MISPEVKKILRELIPFKKTLIIVAIAGLIMGGTQARVLMLSKDLMDSLNAATPGPLLQKGLLVIGLTLVGGIARYFNVYMMNFVGEQVTQNIRHRLQKKFMSLNLSFHNTFQGGSGGLISRILNDIVVIQNGLRMFADFFSQPVIFIMLISWMLWLNWKLTASIFIVLPLILWFLRQISRTVKIHSLKGQEDLEKITSTIKESLDGVRIIQSFNLEDEMSNRFLRESDEYLISRKKIHQRVEMAGPVTEFIATALTVGILVYLGSLIATKQATIGDFVGYVAAILGINPPIKKIQESYVRIQETIVAGKRVYSLLEQDSEVPQTNASGNFPIDWKTITYKNVSFSYGTEKILNNINLTIHRGEVIALVGASGSGKSTLVNLLERFFDPTEGEILIDNTPISHIQLKELRSHIALVTQDVFLFSDTVERNIWAGDFTKKKDGVPSAAQSANAHNFITKQGGYQYKVGDRGNLLSGGEKQRVSIARAIFKDAPILILDEATSALDSASEIEVQKGLDHLMEGRTALVIAHRLSTVAKADKIIVMRAGEIVEIGTHQDLLSQAGEYANLHNLQQT